MTASQLAPIAWHLNSWAIPDVPSDIIVEVGGITYALHKFPLVSRCGLLRMLVVEKDETSRVELEGVPGGAEGFELAAKFCYGAHVEMSKYNIALLRCVAEFLDMSEEHGEDNLVSQTEAYLARLGKQTLKDIVATLAACEKLLPMAEELKIVSRCVEWAAVKAVQERESNEQSLITFHEYQRDSTKVHIDWWVEDLSILRIDFYQRVLAAMRTRGLQTEGVGSALVYYAHHSLKGLTKKKAGLWDPTTESTFKVHDTRTALEHEQRILVETIVSLLPKEKQVVSINFLIGLLRTARILDSTLACRLDLEKRIGSQLHRATLDDILIPSLSAGDGDTLFDVDMVHRLFVSFLEQKDDDDLQVVLYTDANEGFNSPSQHPMLKASKLLDAYLTEVASDSNLSLSKFLDLAGLLPEYARPVEDGLYRAIDIFLKAHPSLTDVDRKKVCRLLDFQKLSQEASTHAAQNERLPVQAVVQVLFLEQLRIRSVMSGAACHQFAELPDPYINQNFITDGSQTLNGDNPSSRAGPLHRLKGAAPVVCQKDHYASVRRENRELKLEVARMKMRLSDLEKEHQSMKQDMERGHSPHSHQYHHGFLHAVSKSISKLNPFHHQRLTSHHKHHNVHHQCKSLSQPEPQRRANSVSSSSSKTSGRDRLSVS